MSRRRNRIPISKKVRKEMCRQSYNSHRRDAYAQGQKEKFFDEYSRICKKYGCYITGDMKYISKAKRGDLIHTVKSHLENMDPREAMQ